MYSLGQRRCSRICVQEEALIVVQRDNRSFVQVHLEIYSAITKDEQEMILGKKLTVTHGGGSRFFLPET